MRRRIESSILQRLIGSFHCSNRMLSPPCGYFRFAKAKRVPSLYSLLYSPIYKSKHGQFTPHDLPYHGPSYGCGYFEVRRKIR